MPSRRFTSPIRTRHRWHSRVRRLALLVSSPLIGCTEPTPELLPRDIAGLWTSSSGTVDVSLHVSHSVATTTEYVTGASYLVGSFTCRGQMSDSRVSSETHEFARPPFAVWEGQERPVQIVSLPLAGVATETHVYGYSFIGRPATRTTIPGHIYRTSRRREEPPEATRLDSIALTLRRH